jgi:uncharacterized protein YgiM (DUF1202 family)
MTSNLLIAMILSGRLLAQPAANSPPAQPETKAAVGAGTNTNITPTAPADSGSTNAPAATKKAAPKKKSAKKPGAKPKQTVSELKTIPLVPGPAIVDANHVNVRGQPKLNSEVIARLSKDQKVTVITEISRKNSGPDEPSAWAKIVLPSDVHVWVNAGFIDPANKTVKSKKLNVRGGPGENFSVLGRLERGETVNQVSAKGDWIEIEAPTNSYAFVAAQYLKQEATSPEPTPTPVEPVPAPATVTNEPAIATAPTEAPTNAAPTAPLANADSGAVTPAPAGDSNAPAADEPPPKRIVEREGFVRGMTSIQAPSHYKLVSPENGRTIDYLYTSSPNLDLSRYKGLRIVVTGEEGLEERWGNTPVITIQKIQVIE